MDLGAIEYDLEINDPSIERCFLVYDEIGEGYDEVSNGLTVLFVEANISKVIWYKNGNDSVDEVFTVRVNKVYYSNTYNVSVQWHDESFKNNINAIRLMNLARSELIEEITRY